MTSRKFNYQCDSDKQTISWATSLRAKYDGLLTYESCLRIHSFTSTAEKILLYKAFMHITHKKASNLGKEVPIKKYRRSIPIPCLAVMEVARSFFAQKEQS